MAVVVPGNPSAIVTYSAERGQFDALRPSFEAHAASIRGAEERGALGSISWESVLKGAIIGGIGGALVGLGRRLFKKKQQA